MKRKTLILLLAITILLFPSVLTVIDVKAEENSWTTLTPMLTPRASFDAAVVDGKIYAIGGTSKVTEEYDPATNTWTTKAAVPTGRSSLVTVAVQNKIYAIGGYDDEQVGTPIGKNEMYDPVTDTWATKTEMPTARGQMCANTVDGQIYVMGGLEWVGYYKVEESNKTEAYNPATNTWITKAELPYAVADVSSVVVGDKIYVLSSPIQIYDIKTDSWSIGSFLPEEQSDADALTISDEQGRELIYIFGGGEKLIYSDLVQIYDPENDVWGVGSHMPTPRRGLAVVVVKNQIYALGGATCGGGDGVLGTLVSANERYTPLESGSMLPSPSPEPTTPTSPTPLPSEEPQQLIQEVILGVAITLAVIGVGLGLLLYLIKRK